MSIKADYQDVALKRMKLVALIEAGLLDQFAEVAKCDLIAHPTFAGDRSVLRITQVIWGRIAKRQEVCYPADWWQAVKQRFAPAWFLRRWPVKEKVIVLTARELYPSVAIPELNPIIGIDKSEWRDDGSKNGTDVNRII